MDNFQEHPGYYETEKESILVEIKELCTDLKAEREKNKQLKELLKTIQKEATHSSTLSCVAGNRRIDNIYDMATQA